ncbi:MAG: hypothetical protein V4675_15545 [Verrucomicrobiota bacterium]
MPSPRPIPLIAVLLTLLAVVESGAAPPVLNRLSIPSPMADVSAGQVQLPIEIDFSATEGIERVEMRFLSSAGDAFDHYVSPIAQQSAITGTVKAGIYRGYLVVPGFRPTDTWTISASLFDQAGGSTDYPVLPAGSSLILTTINAGTVDLALPVLTSAVLTPGTVDITSGSQAVTITATAQDDTGIESLSVSLYDPGDRYRGGSYLTPLQMISGTARNGIWQATFSVPAFGPAGIYPVDYYLRDESRRGTYYSKESNLGPNVQASLEVLSSGPVDTAGPILTSVSSTRAEVDVTQSPQTVRLDVAVQDAPAGIREVRIGLESLGGQWPYVDSEAPLTTAPVQTGGEFTIPRYTPPGIYRWILTAMDGADFETSYGSSDLPFPGGFSGTLLVVNNGLTRGTPPVASSFSRSPASLPEGALPGLVEFTVHVSDPAEIIDVAGFLFKSPVTSSSGRNEFPLKLIAGTPQNGTWRGRVKLSRNNLPGDYVTGFRVMDRTGDTATYGVWPYYALSYPAGWPGDFTITAGGPALTAYQSWKLGYFPGDAGNAGEADDPDGDGWPNALEFMLEMNPLSASPGGVDDLSTDSPRIYWNPETYRMELTPSQINPTLGTGTLLKIKGWKSTTLAPGSWSPVSSLWQSNGQRYFKLDVPGYSRKQQFLRLTVEP